MPELDSNRWKPLSCETLAGLSVASTRQAEIVEELSQQLADRLQELVSLGKAESEAERIVMSELAGHELIQQLKRVEQASTEPPTLGGGAHTGFLSSVAY